GHRRPDRPRDVWASLGPIEAWPAQLAAPRPQGGKLDPELDEETGPGCRDFSGVIVEHDVLAGDEGIGQINAEAARQVVIADSRRTQRAGLTGQRAISRSLPERDGDYSPDHLDHGRRGKPEMAMPPIADYREQACLGQLREMGARGLRRDARRQGQLTRGQGPAIEERRHHRRPRRFSDQRRDLGDHGTGDHVRYLTPKSVDIHFDGRRDLRADAAKMGKAQRAAYLVVTR